MACAYNRVYHHNAFGVISSCPCNDGIQIKFGNVALLLLQEELEQVHVHLSEIAANCPNFLDPEDRSITIKTPIKGIVFLFNLRELHLLLDLTRNTCLLLEVDKLLKD